MAKDPEFITCETCQSKGMVDGERCPDCGGQGFIRKAGSGEPSPDETAAAVDLESLKKNELVALAEERGIDSSGTKTEIIERLEAAAAE